MSEDQGRSDTLRERSTYSSFGDDYRGFDAREEEGGSKGLLVIGLAAGVVLVFGTVVWNAYRAGVKADPNDTPIIRADAQDFKKKPDEQGGFQVPNQDKRLFDTIDKNDRSKELVVNLTTEDDTVKKVSDTGPTDLRPGRGATTDDVTTKPTPTPSPTSTPTPEPVLTPTPVPTRTARVEPSLPISPVDGSDGSVQFDPAGNYLVQIMALRDVESAEKAWSQLVEANPSLFAGAQMDIQRADLGARGIFYRLRASAFADRADADAFCESLKQRNQSCIVATRS